MITIKQLEWDNWFSYGEDNNLDLTEAKVTQITGKNGSGKSSIPVILGEVLTGKNAFGKTKQKLFNRYIEKPTIRATIYLDKDGVEYIIKYIRGSTLRLTLLEEGIDISSHSSTNTLKTINKLLGFDFKLLWELIYQSSTNSISFLTDTDTNRKKYLINLFSLDKYLEIHEQFKKINRELSGELLTIKGKLTTINSFIEKNEKEDLTLRELETLPVVSKEDIDKLTDLKVQLTNITSTNKKINDNNMYKSLLKELNTNILSESIKVINKDEKVNIRGKLLQARQEHLANINYNEKEIKKLNELPDICFNCKQPIKKENQTEIIKAKQEYIKEEQLLLNDINIEIQDIDNEIHLITKNNHRVKLQQQVSKELQDLLSKIDDVIPNEIVNEDELKEEILDMQDMIKNVNDSIKLINSVNMQSEAHNSKVKVIKEQLVDYKKQQNILQDTINEKEFIINKIDLIKKAYSTNGLLAYKLEYLVKDLEHQINTYLEELSNGRFQLVFTIKGEKLDIDIIDDGKIIGIEELSAGELARINTSTLLAIRKLMSAISSTKLNILFLDEIMGTLDDEGKEKLIDLLLNEQDLNTFLVSHEYTHPLIPTINIVKENKMSRIE